MVSGVLDSLDYHCNHPKELDDLFTELYEDALEELNYMLDIKKEIKQEIEGIEDTIQGWFLTDRVCTEEKPSSLSSIAPSSGTVSRELKVSVPVTPSIPFETKRGKTKYAKALDSYYNKGQGRILQKAKMKLRRLEKKIAKMIAEIARLDVRSWKNQAKIEDIQIKTGIFNGKKVETQNKLEVLKPQLQWFQKDEKLFIEQCQMNGKRINQLKIQLRMQANEVMHIKSAKQKPADMLTRHEKENNRQKEEFHHLVKQINKVEEDTHNLKRRMNCEADLRIFILPNEKATVEKKKKPLNFYWIKKKWNPPGTKDRPKSNTTRRAKSRQLNTLKPRADHSPDCLQLFKARLNSQMGQIPLYRRLVPFSQAEVKYSLLKKKVQKNFPLQLKVKKLEENFKHQERLLIQHQRSEDLVKVKYCQLTIQLEKVIEFRKYWEESEGSLQEDIDNVLETRDIVHK